MFFQGFGGVTVERWSIFGVIWRIQDGRLKKMAAAIKRLKSRLSLMVPARIQRSHGRGSNGVTQKLDQEMRCQRNTREEKKRDLETGAARKGKRK